jgi:protein-disulfide isomerase
MATLKNPVSHNDHIRGPANAPITLVEYCDYECPHCARAHTIVNQVQLSFRGRLRFVFRHFPLTEIHPHAEIAAESAEFAGAAGLFWDMHDALFENQSRLSIPTIFLIGAALGLPKAAMRNALETGQFSLDRTSTERHPRIERAGAHANGAGRGTLRRRLTDDRPSAH